VTEPGKAREDDVVVGADEEKVVSLVGEAGELSSLVFFFFKNPRVGM
jgi:hypothetical protein